MIPETMRVIAFAAPGEPDVLRVESRAVPKAGPGQILVKVAAAGVNRPDVMQRRGHYPPPPGAPDILGLEIAGAIVAHGSNCGSHRVGDPVAALVPGGGYAEYCLAHAGSTLPWPRGFKALEAAALPETYFTVWTNLFDGGKLEPGETLLVHGGTSGIGMTAIAIGKAFGAKVGATAGSPDKVAACLARGADFSIDYRAQDFVAETLAATGGRGADVILDMVGGDYVARNYAAAAVGGRIVQIATQHGPKVEIDLRSIMMKRLVHTGSTLRPRTNEQKAAIAAALLENVWPLLASGRCLPVIDSTFRFERAAEAHARRESSAHVGKIMLTID